MGRCSPISTCRSSSVRRRRLRRLRLRRHRRLDSPSSFRRSRRCRRFLPFRPAVQRASGSERERQARERERQAPSANVRQPTQAREREEGPGTRIELDSSIYGSVNGGGPEFELRTFNGNIYLRKGK